MNKNYLDYLQDETNINPDFLEDIKYEIDARFYQYGNHFKNNYEDSKLQIKQIFYLFFNLYKVFFKCYFTKIKNFKNIAISSAYFGLKNELIKIGYDYINVPWQNQSNNFILYYKLNKFQIKLKNSKFSDIELLFKKYLELYTDLENYYSKNEIKLLILPQDMGIFERMSIRIFKKLNKKSYIFSHGLPGRYNNIDDNKTNFLVVWGNKIKKNYINAGFVEKKILVSGHPLYQKINIKNIILKSSLNNILVLSKSLNGTPHSIGVRVSDRTNLLLYLNEIKKELLKLGVNSVMFRPHPSENINWYYKYIDANFFRFDSNKSITETFKNSTLVIGPTSTMFIDAILNNVNYLVYEPNNEGNDLNNFPLVPPFDSSDDRLIISSSSTELAKNLRNIPVVDTSIVIDYINPEFDISFLYNQNN